MANLTRQFEEPVPTITTDEDALAVVGAVRTILKGHRQPTRIGWPGASTAFAVRRLNRVCRAHVYRHTQPYDRLTASETWRSGRGGEKTWLGVLPRLVCL